MEIKLDNFVSNAAYRVGQEEDTDNVTEMFISIFVCFVPGNENYTGIAARDTANALRVLAHAVRGVAAGTKNTQTQEYILSTAQQVRERERHTS